MYTQHKSGTDFIIAIVAMSTIAGVARGFFNIGRPVTNVIEQVVEHVVAASTDAAS